MYPKLGIFQITLNNIFNNYLEKAHNRLSINYIDIIILYQTIVVCNLN